MGADSQTPETAVPGPDPSGPLTPAGWHPDAWIGDLLLACDAARAAGLLPAEMDSSPRVSPPDGNDRAAHRLALARACLDRLHRRWPWPGTSAEDTSSERPLAGLGLTLGRYTLINLIGSGGHGLVFLAEDPTLRRRVALKVPRPEWLASERHRKRFLREAQALARLDHPGIVPIHRITDFGLAKLLDEARDENRTETLPFGTPRFMAPEQAACDRARIGPATDVYGLGAILHVILAGAAPDLPVDSPRVAFMDRPDVPDSLRQIVARCLQREPEDRYPTANALADDLRRFLAGQPTRARPPGRWQTIRRRVRRNPAALVILAILAAFTVVLVGGRLWYENRLETARRQSRQREMETQARESANLRRHQYVRDMRRAERLIRESEVPLARQILMRHRPRPGEDDLRGFAWYHLLLRCNSERGTLTGHRGEVYYVEFSPGGDLLASAGKDGFVRIWNTLSWQLVRSIKASETEVNVAAFSPDGKALATVDDDGKLKLWEVATGQCQLEQPAHAGEGVVARFTPDGKTVITGGRTDGLIRLWDRMTGVMRASFRASDRGLESAALSPDGSILATAGGSEVLLWDLNRRERVASLNGDQTGLQAVAFSHDATKLAAADMGSRVLVWEWPGGRLLREFPGHAEGIFAVVFSADDRTIISASDDATIRFWDVATGTQIGVHQGHTGRVWNLALSPDGRTIASAGRDGTVKLWDSEPPRDYLRLPSPNSGYRIGFSADGRSLLTLERGNGWFVARRDVQSGLLLERKPVHLTGTLWDAAFSRDGRWVAITTREGLLTLWNAATGRLQCSFDQARAWSTICNGRSTAATFSGATREERSRFGT